MLNEHVTRHHRWCAPPILPDQERRESKEAVSEFGVAYSTMQCADLLANGAPGIHFYTLNRSPATRAILSTLKLWRPWDAEHTGLGEPRRPVAPA